MGRRFLTFPRLLAFALLLAAVVPTLSIGILTSLRLGDILANDAERRAATAAEAAATLLARERADLRRLVDGYAGWPTLQEEVQQGRLSVVQTDVLDFLVQQGTADEAVLAGPDRLLASGIADLPGGTDPRTRGRALLAAARIPAGGATEEAAGALPGRANALELVSAASANPTEVMAALSDGVYVAAARPLGDPGSGWWVLLARRLDARFALDVHRLTGFDAALLGADDRLLVATDPVVAATFAPLLRGAARAATARTADAVAAVLPLGGAVGTVPVRLVVSTELQAVEAAGGQLPALVAASAVATVALAAVLAVALSEVLNRRLRAIHDGLVAVAEGRLRRPAGGGSVTAPGSVRPSQSPPSPGPEPGDVADRLQAAFATLVAVLDRRETILRRSLEAADRIPIAAGPTVAGEAVVREVGQIFELGAVAIVDPRGQMVAETGGPASRRSDREAGSAEPSAEPAGRRVEAPMDLAGRGWRLVGTLAPAATWEAADEDAFRVVALLLGTILRDADQYHRAARRAAELDRLNALQRDFVRSVSHNLRTPLTTISLAADDLAETAADAFVAARATGIRTEAARLRRLVDQILTHSRLEAGTLRLEGDVVPVVRAIDRVWGDLGSDRPFTVVADPARAWAVADRAALEQVLWILLDNAVRHGQGAIRVEVTADRRPPAAPTQGAGEAVRVLVAVRDEGPGVPPGARRRIFRRFGGFHRQGGLGLGLSLARGLARAMGGDVRYRAQRRGACFVVELPGVVADPPPAGDGDGTGVERPGRSP